MHTRPSRARLMDYRGMVDGCDAASVFGGTLVFNGEAGRLMPDLDAVEARSVHKLAANEPFFQMSAAAIAIRDHEDND